MNILPASTTFFEVDKNLFQNTQKVLRVICYFDLFNYPLTAKEIFERSGVDSIETVEAILNHLVKNDKSICEHEVLFTQ